MVSFSDAPSQRQIALIAEIVNDIALRSCYMDNFGNGGSIFPSSPPRCGEDRAKPHNVLILTFYEKLPAFPAPMYCGLVAFSTPGNLRKILVGNFGGNAMRYQSS
jgi:hypothetical protein